MLTGVRTTGPRSWRSASAFCAENKTGHRNIIKKHNLKKLWYSVKWTKMYIRFVVFRVLNACYNIYCMISISAFFSSNWVCTATLVLFCCDLRHFLTNHKTNCDFLTHVLHAFRFYQGSYQYSDWLLDFLHLWLAKKTARGFDFMAII